MRIKVNLDQEILVDDFKGYLRTVFDESLFDQQDKIKNKEVLLYNSMYKNLVVSAVSTGNHKVLKIIAEELGLFEVDARVGDLYYICIESRKSTGKNKGKVIQELISRGVSPRDYVRLTKTKSNLERIFKEEGIPVEIANLIALSP